MNEKEDVFVNNIRELRKVLRPKIDKFLMRQPEDLLKAYRQKLNIIVDALVYLTYKRSEKSDLLDESNEVIAKINNEEVCDKFIDKIFQGKVVMQNVINAAVDVLDLKKMPEDNLQYVIENSDIKNHLDANIAINMYVTKGKYNWVNAGNSEFKKFLADDSKSDLSDYAKINCWEAVLYGLMKSGVIERETLKNYYDGNVFENQDKLAKWLDFKEAEPLSSKGVPDEKWREILKMKSRFIMMGDTYSQGLTHDMISVPFSQKQMLKMLITKKFDEEPSKAKLYSHWTMWTGGSLGSVKKKQFHDKLQDRYNDVKTIDIDEFAKKGKENIKKLDNTKSLWSFWGR